MPASLGRENLLTPQIWGDIDKAVKEEVGRIRVAQKVFPTVQTPDAASVPVDEYNPGAALGMVEGQTRPFIEIFFEFIVTQAQMDNEATLHNAQKLARRAARSVAQAEDLLIIQGGGAALPQGVQAVNAASAGGGLLPFAAGRVRVIQIPGAAGTYRENAFTAVTGGIAGLNGVGHPGSYALLLSPATYGDANAPVANLQAAADRITPLMTGGFYPSGALPANRGLLVSLGGEPTTLYLAQDAVVSFNQRDNQGNYRFRVFERIQYVAREADALVRLEFE